MDTKGSMMQRGAAGVQVAALLNPTRGYRDEMRRRGKEPKDYAKANARAIKDLETKMRSVQAQAFSDHHHQHIQHMGGDGDSVSTASQQFSSPALRLTKSSLYKNVKARVAIPRRQSPGNNTQSNQMDDNSEPQQQKAGTHTFLRRKSKGIKEIERETRRLRTEGAENIRDIVAHTPGGQTQRSRDNSTARAAVPKATELASLAPRETKDYIGENKKNSAQLAIMKRRSPAQQQQQRGSKAIDGTFVRDEHQTQHAGYGKVPEYLTRRKAEWKEDEERRRQEEEDECPEGMTRVSESERMRTLGILCEEMEATQQKLQRLPLVIDTMRQLSKKAALEVQLREQEEAIAIFSKKMVYVSM